MGSERGDREWPGPAALAILMILVAVSAAPAQTFTSYDFEGGAGEEPYAAVVQGTDGELYGTTWGYGLDSGTIFKMAPNGNFTSLYNFCYFGCPNGANPYGALVQAPNGNFYGTTWAGGASNGGSVFEITAGGILTSLHSFCAKSDCADGETPYSTLVLGTDGSLYGTTSGGGNHSSLCGGLYGCGTVFKITQSGALTTLYAFCGQANCTDGDVPIAGLVQGNDGNFYGTTSYGGAYSNSSCGFGCGTVFRITPRGTLTTLHSFDGSDGYSPYAGLIRAADGSFYGTTASGTVFQITAGGVLTTLHRFDGADGAEPLGTLIQATDGKLYGTTATGGTGEACGGNGCGTVFQLAPTGTLTTLHSFDYTDGSFPAAGLIQYTDGSFYGTTTFGGNLGCRGGCGTVFRMSVGLGPFVETQPDFGKVGRAVKILGNNLTGSTTLTFNGTSAVFKVISPTEIGAVVPAGSTSGAVQVVTPSGTLSSNVPFRVLP